MPASVPNTVLEIERHLPELTGQYHRLLLLVGPAGSAKTATLRTLSRGRDLPYLNLTLSRRLLALTATDRPLRVYRILAERLPSSVLQEAAGLLMYDDNAWMRAAEQPEQGRLL